MGVMQGRLLPKYQERYQAHPLGRWQEEFKIAKDLGLDCIEFILDYNDAEKNPLLTEAGIKEILAVCQGTQVNVRTICADYFMVAPLHAEDDAVAALSLEILQRLIIAAVKLNVTDIVIPCVDQSTLADDNAVSRFISQIKPIILELEEKKINLSLETDLAPAPFVALLDQINSKRITVNYDIGNSAALGYDPEQELDAYGHRITDVHIKDRLFQAGPVILGEGSANFKRFFDKLKSFNYTGPFIMQAYRDDEGVQVFKKQLEWVQPYLNQLNG